MKRLLTLVVAAVLCTSALTQQSQAGVIVTGLETSPGLYSLTFGQDATIDPIQTKGFIPLNFTIDSGLMVAPGSPTGSLTDGTTTLGAGLTGWAGGVGDLTFNPNLVTSPTSAVTFMSTAGIDFSVTTVTWRFTSAEFFSGSPLTGVIQQGSTGGGGGGVVPEPTSFAIFAIGLIGLCGTRKRRS